ncbi:MAG: hypothetical protein ACRC10_10845 [Thermoguttaceae bacterium]
MTEINVKAIPQLVHKSKIPLLCLTLFRHKPPRYFFNRDLPVLVFRVKSWFALGILPVLQSDNRKY